MHQIKLYLTIILLLFGFFACIEPYDPPISSQASRKYIVSGQILDQEGYQYVTISLAAPIDNPHYIPLGDCIVTIIDDRDNRFSMEEYEEGKYRVWFEAESLNTGTLYRLNILTPSGVEIVSRFEEMLESPKVDSVYYKREDILTNNPEQPIQGIQFYINVDAADTGNKNFRWDIEETWEYHSEYPLEWYYDGQFHQVSPPDYSRNVCWSTNKVADIYTLSVNNSNNKVYNGFPLHFVDNQTSRLTYCYSILIKQYALSEDAYVYWDQMRINSSVGGGLYEKQPISIKGNLISPSNPEIDILGFFSVASVKSKRIFVKNIADLELDYNTYCPEPVDLDRMGWRGYSEDQYPVYFILENEVPKILTWICVDCLQLGGTTVKPDYWPEDDY